MAARGLCRAAGQEATQSVPLQDAIAHTILDLGARQSSSTLQPCDLPVTRKSEEGKGLTSNTRVGRSSHLEQHRNVLFLFN